MAYVFVPRIDGILVVVDTWHFTLDNSNFNARFLQAGGFYNTPHYQELMRTAQLCISSGIAVKQVTDPDTGLIYNDHEVIDAAVYRKGLDARRQMGEALFPMWFTQGVRVKVLDLVPPKGRSSGHADLQITGGVAPEQHIPYPFRVRIDDFNLLRAGVPGETLPQSVLTD